MIGFGLTDVGLIRQNNEDTIFVSNEPVGVLPNLYIVSDGMGGHNAGEVASSRGTSYFCEAVKNMWQVQPAGGNILDILADAVKAANKRVYDISRENSAMSGMGATFSACVLTPGKLYAVHVGDSKVYVVRGGAIKQVTTDHTYVHELVKAGEMTEEEARRHPKRNIITRALGTDPDVSVDALAEPVSPGDYVLICSDGLSDKVPSETMLRLVSENPDVSVCCEKLIESAKNRGGDDNISVILILVSEVAACI